MVAQSVTSRAITRRRVRRCVIAQPHDPAALDAIAFGGSVSTEQPFCDRQPPPYYCAAAGEADAAAAASGTEPRKRFPHAEARRTAAVCNATDVCKNDACPTLLSV